MIQIKINGEYLETPENLSLTLQQGVEDPSSISSRSFKHSYTISVENNSENRRIFNYYDPKKTRNFNQVVGNDVEIFSDGTQIFIGTAKVTEISDDEIKFFCVSKDADWVKDIQGNLKDLDFGTGYTFCGARPNSGTTYPSNAVFMTDFWTGNTSQGITTNEAIQFPLISYGNFYVGEFIIEGKDLGIPATNVFTCEGIEFIKDQSIVRVDFNYGTSTTATSNELQISKFLIGPDTYFNLIENGSNISVTAPLIYFNDLARMNFIESTEYYNVGLSPLTSSNKYAVIHELEMEDIPPCVNLKKTFETVFSNAGWRIQSSFLESGRFKNLYMTYSGKKDPQWNWGTLSNVQLNDSSMLLYVTNSYYTYFLIGAPKYFFNFIDASEEFDYGSIYDTTNGYYIPKTGKYKITLKVTGTTTHDFAPGSLDTDRIQRSVIYLSKRVNSSFADNFETDFDPDGFSTFFQSYTPGGNQLIRDEILWWFNTNWASTDFFGDVTPPYNYITVPNENYGTNAQTSEVSRTITTRDPQIRQGAIIDTTLSYTYYLDLELNSNLRRGEKIKISNAIGSPLMVNSSNSVIDFIECDFILIQEEDGTAVNNELMAQDLMPEMTQVEYVKSIINEFNLYSITDTKNRTVLFEPRDQFILPSNLSLDFTNKEFLDFKQSPFDISKFYEFGWAEDNNDIWSIPIELNNGLQLWSSRGDGTLFNTIDQVNAQGSEKITSKIGFCAERKYHNRVPVYNGYYYLNIPTMMGKNDEFVPQRNVSWSFDHPPKIVEWQGMTNGAFVLDEQLQSQYPYAASTYATGMTLTWYDKNLFQGNLITTTDRGMFHNFYANQFNEYINSELTEVSFILETKDYLDLDTRKQVFWNECHFRVIDIQYQPTTRIAKLKMIKTNI